MSQVSLRAETGRSPGSRRSRRIRRSGRVPAIVYGKGVEEPVPVAVDAQALQKALHTEAGTNAIINLEVEGGGSLTTMARVIDRHPFKNQYRHVDFVTIDLAEKVTAEVAIQFEGTPVGVREGGVLSPRRTHVLIEVLPTEIPRSIELDVSGVELNESLRIKNLPEIEGVEYLEDADAVVMSVTAPAAEVEEEAQIDEDEMEEGEEAAEDEGEEAAESEETDESEDGE